MRVNAVPWTVPRATSRAFTSAIPRAIARVIRGAIGSTWLPPGPGPDNRSDNATDAPAASMASLARLPARDLLRQLGSSAEGLTDAEAAGRLLRIGPNQVAREQRQGFLQELAGRAKNPLNALLLSLAAVSWLTGDARAAIVICLMVVLSVTLAFVQEHRSNQAAAKLRAMVRTQASVHRRPDSGPSRLADVPIEDLVPGDLVQLSAGDLVPADLRVLVSKSLHINQAALTGEAMPVDRLEQIPPPDIDSPFELQNICFMGSNVVSGSATAVVLQTGPATAFGRLADKLVGQRVPTSFDRGVTRFTWLMIRFICVMVPAVFLINGLTKGNWLEALLFAVAVAVGLTPECCR
jgi:P-type Mg2+ transporter